MGCINKTSDCDEATVCPCLIYEEREYSIDEAIIKLKQLIQLNMCPKLFREVIGYLEELEKKE